MHDLTNNPLFRQGMRINHLRVAVAIAEEGQIGRAATRLGLSQPATSRLLAELERVLGTAFCARGPHGVALSQLGEAFAARAKAILLEADGARRDLGEIARGEAGTVRIGSVTAPSVTLVVPVVQALAERLPKVEAHVTVSTSDVLSGDLLRGDLDFILARVPRDLDPALFEVTPLRVETVAVLARRGHPLCGGAVGLRELARMDWILQPVGALMRSAVESAFIAEGLAVPRPRLITNSLVVLLAALGRSDAVAPVAEEVAGLIASGADSGVCALELAGRITVEPYSLVTVAGRHLSPTARQVHEAILEAAGG